MEKAENLCGKRSLFASAAVLAPMVQAASKGTWPVVLLIAVAAFLLGKWCRYSTGWVLIIQRIWNSVLISAIMRWSTYYWRELPFCSIVPFVLLVLGVWTVSVPEKAQRIGTVLLWPIVLLLGAVLLSGLPEVELSYLKPAWRAVDLSLFTVLLMPMLRQKEKREWKLPAASVLVCVLIIGVLSVPVSISSDSGIYELSRSLSLLGIAERFESLVAATMTIGFFVALTYLLDIPERKPGSVWIYTGIAAVLYLVDMPENGWILGLGSVLVWAIFPQLKDRKIISKIGKKSIDN